MTLNVPASSPARPSAPAFVREGRHALLSVSDRTGLDALARALQEAGWHLWASDGTRAWLDERGVRKVHALEKITGFAALLKGRVKTLDARIHAGVLARDEDEDELAALGVPRFSLVAVNLYPFSRTLERARGEGGPADENALTEVIDIGGPALLRAAAKNAGMTAPVPSPALYGEVIAALKSARDGRLPKRLRRRLAALTFAHTADYDRAIARWLADAASESEKQDALAAAPALPDAQAQDLRYGENPHQKAALYAFARTSPQAGGVARAARLQGPPLSYNNYADLDAAWTLAQAFEAPAAVVVKHATPCGVAVAPDPASAIARAIAAGRESSFGGVLACNRPADEETARALGGLFLELLAVPARAAAARTGGREQEERPPATLVRARPRLRIVAVPPLENPEARAVRYKSIGGGLLAQEADFEAPLRAKGLSLATLGWRQAGAVAAAADDLYPLAFAWRIARATLSNGIVAARAQNEGAATLAIAGGHTSRAEAARAIARTLQTPDGRPDEKTPRVAASDGFFPFADGVEALIQAGVRAIVQPGGSKGDPEVIAAADEAEVALLFTGRRAFRH